MNICLDTYPGPKRHVEVKLEHILEYKKLQVSYRYDPHEMFRPLLSINTHGLELEAQSDIPIGFNWSYVLNTKCYNLIWEPSDDSPLVIVPNDFLKAGHIYKDNEEYYWTFIRFNTDTRLHLGCVTEDGEYILRSVVAHFTNKRVHINQDSLFKDWLFNGD